MPSISFSRAAIAAAASLACAGTFAQDGSLKEVTVTGNPLGATDLVAPVQSIGGQQLLLRSQPSLGETLNGTPGVSSTYYGPAASRPIVRGLDGDRVRVLNNSGASVDVSGVSYDHAVAADPITVERIEVLRGPGALLYGGNAIGGAVNLIDNRIPREASPGISGRADLGFASANSERGGAAWVDGGTDRVGLHVDAYKRRTSDVRVPIDLACTQGGVTRVQRRICNSWSDTDGGAVGGSVLFDNGYLGASVAQHNNRYGSVAEDDASIRMRSNRYALEGEWRELRGPLQSLKFQASHTDYRHTEFDAAVPGTLFTSRGSDLRVEARHAPLGALQGVVGVQAEDGRFEAVGEEAFAPPSRTRSGALFALEEYATGWGKLSLGLRREQVDVDAGTSALAPRFVAGSRSFSPTSAAFGVLWKLDPQWQLTANLSHSERAPKDYELFANGPHLATGAYEIGNRNLRLERANSVDVGAQWKRGADVARLNAFATQFQDYVALYDTGTTVASGGDTLPVFAYTPVRARFRGLEASGNWRLLDAGRTLDLEWRGDLVRADDRSNNQPLPRIAPARVGATLAYAVGAWSARLGADVYARQTRVPAGQRETAGYTLWNAALSYKQKAGPSTLLWYARLDNITDRLAYSASSILTQTAPGRVPLPGRSVRVGVEAAF
jgi:iron complex outermembrane receptor protein